MQTFLGAWMAGGKAKHAFLRAWVKAPLKVGAVVPSSRALARCMAHQVDINAHGWVVELGAGTGVMTRALLEAGVDPERLLVVEREKRLVQLLQARFPQLRIIRADARYLMDTLHTLHIHEVSAVVSSLPLLSMPPSVQQAIVGQMFEAVGNRGRLVQFTYGPASPIQRRHLKAHNVHAKRVARVWRNVPPAAVWRFER
jgi:phosphatidylethanolamine/phosphatidyl-N-methylethanolamine N-methyltransferase